MIKKLLLVILILVVILTSACVSATVNPTPESSPVVITQIAGFSRYTGGYTSIGPYSSALGIHPQCSICSPICCS